MAVSSFIPGKLYQVDLRNQDFKQLNLYLRTSLDGYRGIKNVFVKDKEVIMYIGRFCDDSGKLFNCFLVKNTECFSFYDPDYFQHLLGELQ